MTIKKLFKLAACGMLVWSAVGAQAAELSAGQSLKIDQSLSSDDGKYFLAQQGDGNLVVYRKADMKPMWATYTKGTETVMQHDGNLVQYNGVMNDPNYATWHSHTSGYAYDVNFKVGVSNFGYAYVKHPNGKIIWNSPPDASLPGTGPCQGGGQMSMYSICLNSGSPYQMQSVTMACTQWDAMAQTFYPNSFGICPMRFP